MILRPSNLAARVAVAALLALPAACDRATPEVREFRGSYPEHASPTGVVREFDITAAPARVDVAGRGLEVWSYNGQIPGPTLRLRLGETLRVRFTNRIDQPTTIHWHGVRVPNAMDGVPHVTQPPVMPGEGFVYEFTPKDAGTFWFHPHLRSSEQVERGLFGVLVVDDAEPLPYSKDVVWVLDDWRLASDGQIDPNFNTRHDLVHDGRWGNVITVNGQVAPSLAVEPGERIRLRLVNVANGRVFEPDFSGIGARVIAVDGMTTAEPLAPDGFRLAPGNRLDLDLVVPAALAGKTLPIENLYARTPAPIASLVVGTGSVATPQFAPPTAPRVPAWKGAETIAPRAEYRLNVRKGGPFGLEWTINDQAFDHDHDTTGHEIETLPIGEFSVLRFTNESFRLHPMHIHGTFFKLLARNGVRVDEPFWRDTVLLERKDVVDVGLVPVDPGRWMLHCHILEHAESGMMTLVEVR